MPIYSAYGLVVDSAIRLPELKRTRAEPDVSIQIGTVSMSEVESVEDYKLYSVSDGHAVAVSGVGTLLSTGGCKLVVDPAPNANPDQVRQLVLGQGFRALLYQRGYLVVHASATVVDDVAVVFAGESGQGKSTTVSAFYSEGYPILTDDVTAIDLETLSVRSGFPNVKLDREAADFIDADLTRVGATDLGRPYYRADQDVPDNSIPLGGLYFLAESPTIAIEPIPPSERPYRLMCVSASTYCSASDEEVKSHLNDCARLSSDIPVRQLERPLTFDSLSKIVRAVEDDLTQALAEQ